MNEIFSYSLRVFRNNYRYIIELSVPFIILGFLSYFFEEPTASTFPLKIIIGFCIYLVGISMYQCSLILFLSQVYQNKLLPVKTNLLNALVYTPIFLVILIITYSPFVVVALILFSSEVIPLITIPLLIAGVYISLKSTFAPFHLILEGEKPIKAIVRSFSQTKGRIGKIVIILLVFYFATTIIDGLTSFQSPIESINMFMFFVGVASTIFLVSIEQAAVFKLYVESCYETNKG